MKIETLAEHKIDGKITRMINVSYGDSDLDQFLQEILDLKGVMWCRTNDLGWLEFKHISVKNDKK